MPGETVVLKARFLFCSSGEDEVAGDDTGEDEEGWKGEEEDILTDDEFDEAVLMQDTRKSLKGLSPEAALEEVR